MSEDNGLQCLIGTNGPIDMIEEKTEVPTAHQHRGLLNCCGLP
jgi:hypothetical protein